MARKTISVEKVKELANNALLHTPDEFTGNRNGIIHMVESILHETGNYHGFQYLDSRDMSKSVSGFSVGINTYAHDNMRDKFKNTDETRRKYF